MYEIEELRSPPSPLIIQEISAFLAAFVRGGQLANPLPGDDEEDRWAKRMSWWWLSNPFCRPGTPIAIVLREQGRKIVGFTGFIPHDYELDGHVVPGLMTTTFFVSEEHRGNAMSIILRAERYTRDYHLVDGSPSEKMQRILDRLKYERFSLETQYLYIVRQGSLAPKAMLSRLGSALLRQGSRASLPNSARFVNQPQAILSVPPRRDHKLRRRVTSEGLAWFMASGTEPKRLIAVCDTESSLLAYGIGVIKKTRGLNVLRIIEYASFDESSGLDALFSYAATHPEAFELSGQIDLLAWPIFGDSSASEAFLRLRRPATLYYKVPSSWQHGGKVGIPGEGDMPLL
jgi:hypothetical protein